MTTAKPDREQAAQAEERREVLPMQDKKETVSWQSFWGAPLLLALLVTVLDLFSKFLVIKFFPEPGKIYVHVIPGYFSLVHFRNTGAAWGIFAKHTYLLALISCLALMAIIVFYRKLHEGQRPLAIAYAILAGGIAGNLYDRAFRGSVVDFLFFYLRDYKYSWPAFNIADAAICCSVIFMLCYSIFQLHKTPAKTKPEP